MHRGKELDMAAKRKSTAKKKVLKADYNNPEYVEAVAAGLRKSEHFDPVEHFVQDGKLIFRDKDGRLLSFDPLTSE